MLQPMNDRALARNLAMETNDEVSNACLIVAIMARRQNLDDGFVTTSWALECLSHTVCLAILRADSGDLHARAASLTRRTIGQFVEIGFDCGSDGLGVPMICQRDGHGHWVCKRSVCRCCDDRLANAAIVEVFPLESPEKSGGCSPNHQAFRITPGPTLRRHVRPTFIRLAGRT